MAKITLKTMCIMVAIAFFMLEKTLHTHPEMVKDDIQIRFEKLFQTYYGKGIGVELLKQNL